MLKKTKIPLTKIRKWSQKQIRFNPPMISKELLNGQIRQAYRSSKFALSFTLLNRRQSRTPQKQQKIQDEKEEVEQNQEEKDNQDEGDNQSENDEDQNDDEKDKDDNGKSIRKGSSDSIRQSQMENDTSQPQAPGGKKCFNKLCQSKKIYRKIRSKVETSRYRFLCKSCYDNYVNNSFCQFCEQIYSNYQNQDQDMNKWVGCDKCDRWNHIQCERKFRHKNFDINNNTHYQCLTCSKKNRNGGNVQNQNAKRKGVQRQYENTRNYRAKIQINKQDRIPIFHKKPENFPYLEPFLQSYNFRLWINQNSIRQDIEAMRSLSRRPPLEDQPKKMKKIKD